MAFNDLIRLGASAAGDYEIEKSLRFNDGDSAYLSRTFSSVGNRRTFTFSSWMKITVSGNTNAFFSGSKSSDFFKFMFRDDARIEVNTSEGGSDSSQVRTTRKFRDPSAWYHVVIAYDTTQGNSADRVKIYINGTQETAFDTNTLPAQDHQTAVNHDGEHLIGNQTGTSNYFDGYMADVHFIDGQQLTPSSFGKTDVITGAWIPKKYAGSYGTNGFYLPFTGDSLNNSFTDSSSYSRTVTAVGSISHSTTQKKIDATSIRRPSTPNSCIHVPDSSDFDWGTNDWTLECWIRRDAQGADEWLMAHSDGTGANTSIGLHIWSSSVANSNKVNIRMRQSSSNINCTGTTELAADTWYHVAGVRDGNTLRLYINGVQENTTSISGSPDTSSASFAFTALRSNGDSGLTGYMDEIRVSKSCRYTSGTSFTPSTTAFSSDANTLVLIHSNFTGTDIAADASGNNNNWSHHNISITAGIGNDSLEDTPTNNFCTLNSLVKPYGTNAFSQGNLHVDPSNDWNLVEGTFVVKSGKWYWEQQGGGSVGPSSRVLFGICSHGSFRQNAQNPQTYNGTIGYYDETGQKRVNNTYSSYGASYNVTGDVIGTALDMDARTVTFYKNGASQGAIDLDDANDPFLEVTPACFIINATEATFNFGQRPFAHSAPANHKTLCTANLSEPTIKKGSDYFDIKTYTGTGSSHAITGLAFQPDLVYSWRRNGSGQSGLLIDSVRGGSKSLASNSTAVENTNANRNMTFQSNGVTWTSDSGHVNASGGTYVNWYWKEAAAAGFDIITYTGNDAADRDISHNLGVAPEFWVVKARNATQNWFSGFYDVGKNKYLLWESSNAAATNTVVWSDELPTSAHLTVGENGAGWGTNEDGDDYIGYLFASVEGYCKVGNFVGNGSTDGTFVYTGFRPRFVMTKKTDGVSHWYLWDSERSPYNQVQKVLWMNYNSETEGDNTAYGIDFLSNGFKVRNSETDTNTSNSTQYYLAYAERPFKYTTAR